jgi:hypothetical protein
MSEQNRFRWLFAVLMSLQMSLLMTGWVTWVNLGLGPRFLSHWAHAFLLAWPAACLIVLLTGPLVQQLCRQMLKRLAAPQDACP